jgi:glyoxylate/hydroxypyruvate reductase
MRERGVKVGFAGDLDLLSDAVAEHAVTLTLMHMLKMNTHVRSIRNGDWARTFGAPLYGYNGSMLAGKTVGIFGLGRIGRAVAERLASFDLAELLYTSRFVQIMAKTTITFLLKVSARDVYIARKEKREAAQSIGARRVDFKELLAQSDVLILCCDLNEHTTNIMNREAFSAMKPTAVVINVSRGTVVNQNDLIEAIKVIISLQVALPGILCMLRIYYHEFVMQSGQIAGAGLDVMTPEPLPKDSPLLDLERSGSVTLTPHMGSAGIEARKSMLGIAVANVIAAVTDQTMPMELVMDHDHDQRQN